MCLQELKPSPVATALLPPFLLCQTHMKYGKGRSLYLYGEFCASLLCSRHTLPEAGSSCLPQLSIASHTKTPQAPRSLYPQAHRDPWSPSTTPGVQHKQHSTPRYSPAPSLPAQHPLAFTHCRAGSSFCPSSIPVRVHKKFLVPMAAKVFSEKQCRLQARV